MIKKIFTVRKVLTYLLILASVFTAWSIYYKINFWGFSFKPNQKTAIWTLETQISFMPTGENIKVSLAIPPKSTGYKILEDSLITKGYKLKVDENNKRVIFTSTPKEGPQTIYYRTLLFDNIDLKGKIKSNPPALNTADIQPDYQKKAIIETLIEKAGKFKGNKAQQLILLFNQDPADETVISLLPNRTNHREVVENIAMLLKYQQIPAEIIQGIKLEESKISIKPDLMLQAYINGRWMIFNTTTGEIGIPKDFVILQSGGSSLFDVIGGENSSIKFSVIKSVISSFNLADKRASLTKKKSFFDYSIYSLPLVEQNTLKWLSIFPLAILIVVIIRNVIGWQTMGTFTPMLLAMSLVKTGLVFGLVCFFIIISTGLLLRTLLSKLNLLMVPRISAVVVFVIIIMQILTIIGHHFDITLAQNAIFFPIIIMSWIIERACIIWEEDGPLNSCKEIFYSLMVAIITYFVINSETIRHIMFAFNEINLIILLVIMLLGTYTGYRLIELKRFYPLVRKK